MNTAHRKPDTAAPTPIYGPAFASNPHAVYEQLRAEHGPVAHVALSPHITALLVLNYELALDVLHNDGLFVRGSARWEATIPSDDPYLAMLQQRPNCLYANDEDHDRLRAVITDSLHRIDTPRLRSRILGHADALLAPIRHQGHADLLGQFARPLPLQVITDLFGCPDTLGQALIEHISAVFDGRDTDHHNTQLSACFAELIAFKRAHPGHDITTWMLQHDAALTDTELIHQLVVFVGAGFEPVQNLICTTLLRLLSDQQLGGEVTGGGMTVTEALDAALRADPPIANYSVTFARQPTTLAGWQLPADYPVVISLAAVNQQLQQRCPDRASSRAHLAWSTGAHQCPARSLGYLTAAAGIERLQSTVANLRLAVPPHELTWRPGPFHRAVESLPVQFTPQPGGSP